MLSYLYVRDQILDRRHTERHQSGVRRSVGLRRQPGVCIAYLAEIYVLNLKFAVPLDISGSLHSLVDNVH